MIGYYGFRVAVAGATLAIGLLAGFGQSAWADSVALSVTGMVSSSDVNGVQVGAGDYTAHS